MNENIRKIEDFLDINDHFICENLCMLAGQFSSGKSRFLNALIGFACLPMGTYETTDVPTYISKGEDMVISYADGKEQRHTFDEVKKLRKGSIVLDSIRISHHAADIPPGVMFVDMPGINSIDPRRDRQFEEVLKKSVVVLYFLGKQISTVDALYLDKMIGSGVKVIIVRTKIDRIVRSEERVKDVVDSERALYLRLFPDIDTYFISLEDECAVNELDMLKTYILDYLAEDIQKARITKEKTYIRNVLKLGLLAIREGVSKNQLAGSMADEKSYLINARKKSRETRRILEERQTLFFDGFDLAKKNYTKMGSMFIQGLGEERIVKADVEQFILCLMDGLKEWYKLELEDVLKQIELMTKIETKYDNLLESVDIDNILNCASTSMLFGNISCYFKADNRVSDYFTTKREAEKYYNQVINRFFAEILMNFQDKYDGFIEETLRNYERQKTHEAKIVLPLVQEDYDGALAIIDKFLEETGEYGY